MPEITYDPEADAVYIALVRGKVERTKEARPFLYDLDAEGQLVASVLSKKVAAGSTHVLIDLPVGPMAKVRSAEAAELLSADLLDVGRAVGLEVQVIPTDGLQPVGRGIGPALEARDVLAVLRGTPEAPADLRDRGLLLAGHVLELAPSVAPGTGYALASAILADAPTQHRQTSPS